MKKKILTVVGARPQFVKAAVLSRLFRTSNGFEEYLVHTGQHYDHGMSQIFFDELGLPQPDVNLGIGGGTHGVNTGRMIEKLEECMLREKPTAVLVYGDTDSTLAGALAAAKLHIPVIHVEAGLRSFNRRMPEEVNRILTDHLSDLLFCPTKASVANLHNENIVKGVFHVGDVMYDAALQFSDLADRQSKILELLSVEKKEYYLATIHRAENTDNVVRIGSVLRAFNRIATPDCPIIFPLHPRTKNQVERFGLDGALTNSRSLRVIPPVGFVDMAMLQKNAQCILTDSGGVQKEAYFHGTPCITLRDETEWTETVEAGWNQLAGTDTDLICSAVKNVKQGEPIDEYGEGRAADKIVSTISESLS